MRGWGPEGWERPDARSAPTGTAAALAARGQSSPPQTPRAVPASAPSCRTGGGGSRCSTGTYSAGQDTGSPPAGQKPLQAGRASGGPAAPQGQPHSCERGSRGCRRPRSPLPMRTAVGATKPGPGSTPSDTCTPPDGHISSLRSRWAQGETASAPPEIQGEDSGGLRRGWGGRPDDTLSAISSSLFSAEASPQKSLPVGELRSRRSPGVPDARQRRSLPTRPWATPRSPRAPPSAFLEHRAGRRGTPQRHEPAPHCGVSAETPCRQELGLPLGPRRVQLTPSPPPLPHRARGARVPGRQAASRGPERHSWARAKPTAPLQTSAAKPGTRPGGTRGPASLWGRPARRTEDHRQVEPSPRSDHGTQAPAPVPEASASACPLGQVPGGPGGHRLPASKGSRSPSVFGGVIRHLVGN